MLKKYSAPTRKCSNTNCINNSSAHRVVNRWNSFLYKYCSKECYDTHLSIIRAGAEERVRTYLARQN